MKDEFNRISAYLGHAGLDHTNLSHTDTFAVQELNGSTIESELADVLDDYLQKLEAGEPVSPDDLVAKYPHLEEAIREYMQGLNLLNAGIAEIADDAFQSGDGANRELGDFELIRELGRGGMGVVYEARQLSLGRTVALKILPFAAMLDKRRVVRFEAEARAAARLQHAHIVPVYSIGYDEGVHYYAMRLIDGRSIRDVIDLHPNEMTPRKSARLGMQAANALHAAHECGIVHRDIKPSNLLLDASDNVWITDFGLARCQTEDNVTRSGDVLGTLHYMSPEQAHGNSAFADPRSDIYSLGVTLYELLTSQRPFEGDSHTEIIKQIELGQFKPIRTLNPAVPRDLENVVAKAMSLEPTLRYQTADELEADLQRFVDGRATHAKPPSKVQLASRWAARNRTLVFALTIISMVSCVGLAAATLWYANASKHLTARNAIANRKVAETESTLEEFGLATAERLKQIPGSNAARRALLQQLLTHYEDLLRAAENDPALREDRAITSTKIANIYREAGELENALQAYRQAITDFRLLSNDADSSCGTTVQLAKCHSNMSVVLMELGEFEQANDVCEQAIALQQGTVDSSPSTSALLDLASSHTNLASIAVHRGGTGVNELRRAATLAEQANKLSTHDERADTLSALTLIYGRLRDSFVEASIADATNYAEQAVEVSQELITQSASPGINDHRLRHATNCNQLASLLVKQDREAHATKLFTSAAEQLDAIEAREDLVLTLSNLGKSQSRQRDFLAATASYEKAITVQAALLLESPGNLNHQSRLGGLYNNIAFSMQKIGELQTACNAYESAIKYQARAHQLAPQRLTYYRDALSRTLFNGGEANVARGNLNRAAELHLRRSELWPEDSEQLFSAAYHIAAAANQMRRSDARRTEWYGHATSMLNRAVQCDITDSLDSRKVDRLATYLRKATEQTL